MILNISFWDGLRGGAGLMACGIIAAILIPVVLCSLCIIMGEAGIWLENTYPNLGQ